MNIGILVIFVDTLIFVLARNDAKSSGGEDSVTLTELSDEESAEISEQVTTTQGDEHFCLAGVEVSTGGGAAPS